MCKCSHKKYCFDRKFVIFSSKNVSFFAGHGEDAALAAQLQPGPVTAIPELPSGLQRALQAQGHQTSEQKTQPGRVVLTLKSYIRCFHF